MTVDPIDTGVCDWIFDGRLKAKFNYTDSDLSNFARLLARPCPFCKARPGDRCRRRDGTRIEDLDQQHVARHAWSHR